jgi:taurine dioxygenase
MKVTALSPALGAEISGLDLSQPLAKGIAEDIYQAWLDHQVLLFRGQSLTPEEQRRFTQCFGDPQDLTRTAPELRQAKQNVMYIGNQVIDGIRGDLPEGEMQFHTDGAYFEKPTKATMLFAVHVPSRGGDTLFTNCYKAYESLPETIKARIAGLSARNVYDYAAGGTKRSASHAANAPSFVHPVVIAHSDTGLPSLYVNRLMTTEIVGLDPAESEALLEILFQAAENPAFIFAHRWRPGDVLVWDNRCTLHARTDFDPKEKRALRRMTTKAVKPVAWGSPVAAAV